MSVRDVGGGRRWTLTYTDVATTSTRSVELPADEYFPPDKHGRVLRRIGDGSIGPPGASSFDWTIDGRAAFGAGSNLFVLSPDGSRRRLT